MTRDYKNISSKKSTSQPIPGWIWMITGLALGGLISLLVYLSGYIPDPQPQVKQTSKKETPRKEDKKEQSITEKIQEKLNFEFYTLLPKSEVVIPERELVERTREASKGAIKPENYMLQAGSFRKQSEAESLKARLALLGIESSIQNVSINNDTWSRVRIGPFTSLSQLNNTRARLRENRVNVILVKSTQ
jgi:cell division protein FtsN